MSRISSLVCDCGYLPRQREFGIKLKSLYDAQLTPNSSVHPLRLLFNSVVKGCLGQ